MSISLATFESLALTLVPSLIIALVPGTGAVIGALVAKLMVDAETAFGSGTGAQKKAAVQDGVVQGVTALNTVKGATVIDPATVSAQVGAGIDLAIGVINDVQTLQAKTPAAAA